MICFAGVKRCRILTATVLVAIVAAGALPPGTARALTPGAFNPIHSYFEGLRSRLPLSIPATDDNPTAVWINPALLGTGKADGLAYFHTYDDSTFSGDDAFSICPGGLAFGVEFFDLTRRVVTPAGSAFSKQSTRRYTVAGGARIVRNLYLGSSYSWHSSENADIDGAGSWLAGALWRPLRKISVGVAVRDINSPEYFGTKFKPIYETSIAIRPRGDNLTLFADWTARAEKLGGNLPEEQPASFMLYGLEYEALQGVDLRFGMDENKNLSASIMFSLATGTLGTVATREHGEDEAGRKSYGAVLASVGPWWHESVLLPPDKYLEIHLSGEIGETRPPFSILGGGGPRFLLSDLVEKIRLAKDSRDIRALVLRCSDIGGSYAVLDELRQAILDFRSGGKPAIAYVDNPGNGLYYLVTACDYIVLEPNGYIGLVGLKSEGLFLKGTLDKLGLKAYYARVGKYKSAVEPLTEKNYTEPSKVALNVLLDDLFEKMVQDIASGRGMTAAEVKDRIDRGPYIPSDAVREGLVDTLAYWDQVPGIVNSLAHGSLTGVGYGRFSRRKPSYRRWGEPPVLGIVYGVGSITHGAGRRDLLMGEIMGSETMMAAFKAVREDDRVKAVIFRVDSPGGVMTASDKIRREVKLTAKRKPVIISMGGVAASGGYHISCDGTMILADAATVTGSIGVLDLWIHTRGLYEKLGASKDIFLRGKHADIFPTWRDVTQEDLDLTQFYVDKFYDKFVRDVARGRGMSFDQVNEVAQGRVWSGSRARELGLVDRIGGLADAISLAKREAGIPVDEHVDFKILPKPGGFLESLRRTFGESVTGEVELPENLRALMEDAAFAGACDEPLLYLMPYRFTIR
jgi:protease-4